MVKYEKYETKTGKDKWKYYGHEGVDIKTGNKIKLRGQGFETKAAAKLSYERKLETLKNEKKKNNKKDIKFSQLLEEYLEYYKTSGIKPGTYKKFKDEMNRYAIPLLGKKYVTKIDVDDCQEAYDKLRVKRKDHRKIKNQIKTLFDFAITKHYITTNPMQYILISKVETRYQKRRLDSTENYYEPQQLMAFLDAYKEVEEFQKFVYFRLLAFSGLRRGEGLALNESDINRTDKSVSITKTLTEDENGRDIVSETPKTNASADVVYLDDDTFDFVIELIDSRNNYDNYGSLRKIYDNNFLFVSPKTGSHYNRSAPNDWLVNFFDRNEDALNKRGLHRISPHGLRHSQATLLYELGIDPKDTQYRLRHANLKTTMDIYTHISKDRKRAPILKLDEFSSAGTISGTTKPKETKKERQEH
ncbi:MAG: tyrosine-type recombinase/integrase [Bacilli bacterium]